MNKEDILTQYKNDIENFKRFGALCNLSEKEINQKIIESLQNIKKQNAELYISFIFYLKQIIRILFIVVFIILLMFIFISFILFNNSILFNFFVRHIQDYIYPSMKLLRWLTLPIIHTFPSLTVLYDEVCLVENPYFEPGQVECWPCNHIQSILTLPKYNEEPINQWEALPHSYYPFVVKNYSSKVSFGDLKNLYKENKNIFEKDAFRFVSNVNIWRHLEDIFENNLDESPTIKGDGHITWRVNRLAPARLLRQLFPRPKFVANSINIERYILIDESHSPAYTLPYPEGYRVFLIQTHGHRLIALHPVSACMDQCHRVSIVLGPGDVLIYNSWLYRPIVSYPTHADHVSIGYLGSADLPP